MIIDWQNKAIRSLVPNAQFSVNMQGIHWNTEENGGVACPSEAEIDAEIIVQQAEYDSQAYARDRQARYRAELPMGDQFDAILKGFNQLRFDGQNLPADLDEVIGIWLGIKSAIPKE